MSLVEIRSATITDKGQIAIPRDMRDAEGFKTGSKIAILAFKDRIELRPLKQVSDRIATAIASEKSLAKHWRRKEEDKAWRNL
jgi:AbrB family looped-hinge helix DNA binding protein